MLALTWTGLGVECMKQIWRKGVLKKVLQSMLTADQVLACYVHTDILAAMLPRYYHGTTLPLLQMMATSTTAFQWWIKVSTFAVDAWSYSYQKCQEHSSWPKALVAPSNFQWSSKKSKFHQNVSGTWNSKNILIPTPSNGPWNCQNWNWNKDGVLLFLSVKSV